MPSLSLPLLRATMRSASGALLCLFVVSVVSAQGEGRTRTPANYAQARKFSSENLGPLTYSTMVAPSWIGKTDQFWYSYRTSQGTRFWKVDPAKKSKTPLFDHDRLAGQLAELSRKPVEGTSLPLTRGQISEDGKTFQFVAHEMQYSYDLEAGKLASKGKASPAVPAGQGPPGTRRGENRGTEEQAQDQTSNRNQTKDKEKEKGKTTQVDRTKGPGTGQPPRPGRSVSPDRKSYLFTKDHNLFLAEEGKENEAAQLTKDGSEEYSVALSGSNPGGGGGRGGRGGRSAPENGVPRSSHWSPDSQHFYVTRQDSRGMKELFVINSLAEPRPALEKYRYSMPGEENIRRSELHLGSREAKAIRRISPRWKDETYSDFHWGKTAGELRFVRTDRPRRNAELCALGVSGGDCKVLISEGFDNAPVDVQTPRYLDESDEMIWWSERTGWGHFYLYGRDGVLKNAITSGPWRASRIVEVDPKTRTLYFLGNSREPGENVYFQHLYSVKLDGSQLRLLDPGAANHQSLLSPSHQFVVDNASRVDQAPESVLRDGSGNKIMDLEKTDLARLKEFGWQLPETFTVKAQDGTTDLFGNLWKPFDFDPKKKYPIIANVYPGPQQEGVTYTFSAYSSNMQLAQLGFIVVQMGHRGGAPTRSKAYGSFGYFNLRDYALADKKAAIEQLAARFPWIDVERVGIYGHSGGGFLSAAALLQKPYNQFFKVAVASAGNHDNNIYNNFWSERYHGLKEVPAATVAKPEDQNSPAAPPVPTRFEIKVPTNAELAANLKGRLLLVHGELDNNVHPANTLRLVDALIKANKRFDMMILPGKRHSFGDYSTYFRQRMWEYFAEHLLDDRRSGAELE